MFSRSDCQLLAVVERHVDGALGPGEEQPLLLRILAHGVDRSRRRECR